MDNERRCPMCGEKIKRLGTGGECPTCRQPLELIDGEYQIVKEDEPEESDEFVTVTDLSHLNVKVNELRKEYVVTYISSIVTGDMRCPECNALLFKNQMLKGHMEHKCRRCKYLVKYIFT